MAKTIQELLAEKLYPQLSPKEVLDTYSDIELTEDEVIEAMIWAKRKKERVIEEMAIKEREAQNRRLLTGIQWDYEQTMAYMTYRSNELFKGKFTLDENNLSIYQLLCYYFCNDKKFEAMALNMGIPNPSLEKGILLAGNFGVGKTWLMRLFAKNQRQVYFIRTAKQIANDFETHGDESLEQYIKPFENASNDSAMFYQKYSGLCIDDMGTEDIKSHYGNRKNVIGDLIELRYPKGLMGVLFHATTNLTSEQLSNYYGGRVISRLREQVNLIELTGKDRRI